ncbi:energy-coupling factor ABC transporter ATP-binding protein [[Eubacterium] cellulosolvens]
MIQIENVSYTFPNGFQVLNGVTLTIEENQFVAIMGENGAGKTTLIRHFNGLLKPTQGDVTVDGVNTRKASVASLSKKVGLVFQNPDHQLFCETVKDEVAFALKNFGFKDSIIQRRVRYILETLDLTRYADSSPFTLSGGERKRVALASVLAWDPKYVILDEPTIGQDYLQKDRLRNFLVQLVSQGKTVLIVTHDIEFVAEGKPKIILLSKGKVVDIGSAQKILSDKRLTDQCSLSLPQMAQLMGMLHKYRADPSAIDVYSALVEVKSLLRRRR